MDRYNNSCEMGGIIRENSNKRSHASSSSEDKSLDLKLAPPGENKPLILSLHNYTSPRKTTAVNNNFRNITAKREFLDTIVEEKSWLTAKEEYHTDSGLANVDGVLNISSTKRIDVRPVVGWPPVRASRKNILNSNKNIAYTTKLETESSKKVGNEGVVNGEGRDIEKSSSSLFVKIKMDGVAIGRKIDLKSYNDYDQLSSAVDQLFRGLLAAQGDFCKKLEKTKMITGLLDGSGDYTLVYEDNEGDRMLVGDVPWPMFISSAKRLRVLKKSELSTLDKSRSKLV